MHGEREATERLKARPPAISTECLYETFAPCPSILKRPAPQTCSDSSRFQPSPQAFCEEALPAGTRVLAPEAGQPCDFSVTTTSYSLKLSEALYERLAFQRCGEYELAWADGALSQPLAALGARGSRDGLCL